MQLIDKDLLSMQEVRELVEAAKAAQRELAQMSQAQVDRIVRAIADAGVRNARRLAQMANEDTGFGIVDDKVIKNIFAEKNQFPATFTVEEDVSLLRVAKADFFSLMHSMPQLLHNFLCVSTSCNRCTMTRLRVLSFRGIRSRYIYYLLDHLKDGSDVVEMEHNQVQLAEYFGVTRPALSKEINKLVDSGFIKISRGKVRILNKQALTCML